MAYISKNVKRYGISSGWRKIYCIEIIFGGILFILGGITLIGKGSVFEEFFEYGWKHLSKDEKVYLIMIVFFIIGGVMSTRIGMVSVGRFFALTDDRIYGNTGLGFAGKHFEFYYSDIVSINCPNYKTIGFETTKGHFVFTQMEYVSNVEEQIQQRLNKAEQQSLPTSSQTLSVPKVDVETKNISVSAINPDYKPSYDPNGIYDLRELDKTKDD